MIKAQDAIETARALLGTPYGTGAGELDCINFIIRIIRNAPGGDKKYITGGTNMLWNSRNSAAKYKDLLWTQDSVQGALPGMLAFKADGADYHHVGLVTSPTTVIHSSSSKGCVVETDLQNGQWDALAIHKLIEVDETVDEQTNQGTETYQATVVTEKDPLRVRDAPVTGNVIGKVPRGATVTVRGEAGGWLYIEYNGMIGYASGEYLQRINTQPTQPTPQPTQPTQPVTEGAAVIVDDAGNVFVPTGGWHVQFSND